MPNHLPRRAALLLLLLLTGLALASPLLAQVNVTRWRNDNALTGQNLQETTLTPANVNAQTFGKLFSYPVDGYVYAQPLYVANVSIPNQGVHNVVFIATEKNNVYAFDADPNAGASNQPLWQVNVSGAGRYPAATAFGNFGGRYGLYRDVVPYVGITCTPVIDLSTNTMYFDAFSSDIDPSGPNATAPFDSHYLHQIHALDIRTGAEKFGAPKTVAASVPGTYSNGGDSVNGVVSFKAIRELQRCAATLVNGVVYFAYAGYADTDPYHGWVLGFSAGDLSLVRAFNTTPNGGEGGIWMSGAGPAADAAGNLYLETGNGAFTANTGGSDYGDSFLKLTASGASLAVSDYFTPYNQAALSQADQDLGSGGALLLPDQPGSFPHLLVGAGKEGRLYLLNRDNLGHFNGTADTNIVQSVQGAIKGCFDTAAYFNGSIYYVAQKDYAKKFTLRNGLLPTSATSTGAHVFGSFGANPSISANGTSNGILWALESGDTGTLYAYDAADLTKQLYTSNDSGARDAYSGGMKFTPPTIANGKVYVPAQNALLVFGLLPTASASPAAPSNLAAHALSSTEVALSWGDHSTNETSFQVERSTDNASFQLADTATANATTVNDRGLQPRTTYYYRVRAVNSAGASAYTNVAQATTLVAMAEDGLVGYWDFAEGAGTVLGDVSGNHDNGTINGEVTWGAGPPGLDNSLGFHGVGNAVANVVIPDQPQLRFALTQSFTLSAWVNSSAAGTKWADIVVKSHDNGNRYQLGISPNNKWAFCGTSVFIEGPTVSAGSWHLVTGVQDGAAGTRKLYVDGVLTATGAAQAADGTGALWFANAPDAPVPFNGSIADVRIYNRALSGDEVQTLANTTWEQADVGNVGQSGDATILLNGSYSVDGSGADIIGTADGFHYVFQQQTGNFQITARVLSVENTNDFAKGGVMIRESLDANSSFADTVFWPRQVVQSQARTATGTSVIEPARSTTGTPVWVRVTRQGDQLTSLWSTDGATWLTLSSATIPMSPTVYVGLCVSAHNNGTLCTSTFDNVKVVPMSGP